MIVVLCYSSTRSAYSSGRDTRTELAGQDAGNAGVFLSGAQARNQLRNYWRDFDKASRNPHTGDFLHTA